MRARHGAALALVAALAPACTAGPPAAHDARSGAALPLRAAVTTGPELCGNAVDDNGNGLFDEGCGTTTSAASFVVAWNEPSADIDLRVTDPNGELVEVGHPTQSGLVRERDCPGRDNECRGKNFESVYQEQGEPASGLYVVRVVLVSLGAAEPPIAAHFAARLGADSYSDSISFPAVNADFAVELRL